MSDMRSSAESLNDQRKLTIDSMSSAGNADAIVRPGERPWLIRSGVQVRHSIEAS